METLAARVARAGPLPARDAVGWVVRLAKRVERLHARGTVHGRLSAACVIMEDEPCTSRGWLSDPMATPTFVSHRSPERAAGEGPSRRDDTWALAVVLYVALSGKVPFPAESDRELRRAIDAGAPRRITPPGAAGDALWRVLVRALARDAAQRIAEVAELRRALEAARPDDGMDDLPPLDEHALADPPRTVPAPRPSNSGVARSGSGSQPPRKSAPPRDGSGSQPPHRSSPPHGRTSSMPPSSTSSTVRRTPVPLQGLATLGLRSTAGTPITPVPEAPERPRKTPSAARAGSPTAHDEPPPAHAGLPPAHAKPPPAHGGVPPAHAKPPLAHDEPLPAHHEPPPAHAEPPPPAHAIPPPARAGLPPAHDEPPPAHHEPPPAHHEPPPAHHEPPPAHHEPPPAHHEPPPAHDGLPAAHDELPPFPPAPVSLAGGQEAKRMQPARDLPLLVDDDLPPEPSDPFALAPDAAVAHVGAPGRDVPRRPPATAPGPEPRRKKPSAARRMLVLALGVLALGAAVAGWGWLRHRAVAPPAVPAVPAGSAAPDTPDTPAASAVPGDPGALASAAASGADADTDADAGAEDASAAAPDPADAGAASAAPEDDAAAADVAACLVPLFPEGSVDAATAGQLSPTVCAEADARKGVAALKSHLAHAAGARGVSDATKEWAVLGWYDMAALAVLRARCCPTSPPLEMPGTPEGCHPMDTVLNDLGAAVAAASDPGDRTLAKAARRYTRTVQCVVRVGAASRYGRKSWPNGGEASAFKKVLARALRGAKQNR